ncbi:Transcription initiation factor IIE subunit alpha [Komagataella phaffii CBS 7435]|uniref:TFIIE large subunit n=2 Tax=Komagataella phaffii TaxID=460519 RepID=C4R3S2_KOMPG|nr:TFIIE large subunit [Komagataella phaffii GS115]AOA64052.1 GQ67_03202T0 [Komagataella phaffii]CAH2450069.1 Transcription initiation factor IIE subunit alpha [Komagataella phaffii CBS 7435]AOA68684.1 GQ68_03187T0 [Komagataella phaffii GS115]CAY70153.1 TFIIE large subunit [Komagataella phaffii GS115]CCA39997.1 Transcription initiation factor IIE subunit alpha [Komagataella phaffii CBS 7435]
MDYELATSLIRFVVRGFYTKHYVLVVEALLMHWVLSEDDLIYLLGMQRKGLRALCNRLVEDRLISAQHQKEENLHQRMTTRTYYYIRFVDAIDAIKWKMHSVVKSLKDQMAHDSDPQGYVCPRCRKRYSQLDALSMVSDNKLNFVCDICNGVLIEDDSGIQAKRRQEKLTQLMGELDPIIGYLKRIDEGHVVDNTFETSLTRAVPAQSSTVSAAESGSYALRAGQESKRELSQSLKNATARSQAVLHVDITTSDENQTREEKVKAEKQEKLKQNALPSWHSESTVGKGTLGKLGTQDIASEILEKEVSADDHVVEGKDQVQEIPKVETTGTNLEDIEAQDALAAYYAQLAEKQAKEDADDDAEDGDEDEDFDIDDDEFEDILETGNNDEQDQ